MKTRGLGRSIMAGGVVCFIIFMMLSLGRAVSLNDELGSLLFYIGIVALPLGGILFLLGEMK